MSATGSPYCEHRKLRTTCPECRAARQEASSTVALPSGRAAAPRPPQADEEPAAPRAAPPRRKRTSRRITREEAERAEAWWVRKR